MSDEPTPEAEVQDVVPETPTETKAGKKAKADKKKPTAQSHAEESQAAANAAVEASGAIEPPPAEAPSADRNDDLFQQGIQALLRGEYDAADNFFGQALTTYREQDNRAGQIDVLQQLGHLCFLRGAEAQAREYYQQAGLMRAV